jgi:hypothetical protein
MIARAARLLTTTGLLRVKVCSLCAAVVVAAGADRHDAVHRVERQRRET